MSGDPFYVCDGPVCRQRAADLELILAGRQRLPCLGRCDAPVAAFTVEDTASRTIARELTLLRRGGDPLPAQAPGAQRGAQEPLLLRDLFLVDQCELEMARRRGAYRTLGALPADLAQLIATATGAWTAATRAPAIIVAEGAAGAGQFAMRPIFERDPHAVVEGLLIAAHAAGAQTVTLELRHHWAEAWRAMTAAVAAAVAAELTGSVAIRLATPPARPEAPSASPWPGAPPPPSAPSAPGAALAVAPELVIALRHILVNGASWWQGHAPFVCAVSGDVLRPGVYELTHGATVTDAIAVAGGVVDGVRNAALGSFLSDGEPRAAARARDLAPAGLIVAHARRDALCAAVGDTASP